MCQALKFASVSVALALVACQRAPRQDSQDVVLGPYDGRAPLQMRVMFNYGGGFNAPARGLSLRGHPDVRLPTALVVPGCAHAAWAGDFPEGFLIVAADEDRDLTRGPTLAEACLTHDPVAIARAVRRQLDFLTKNVGRLQLADTDRIVLFASGEAAPIAAGYRAPLKAKVLLGDPCFVHWPRKPDADTPSVVLRSEEDRGVQWVSRRDPLVAVQETNDPRAVALAVEVMDASCPGQQRPSLPANYSVFDGPGRVTAFGRPSGVQAAGRAAIARLLGL